MVLRFPSLSSFSSLLLLLLFGFLPLLPSVPRSLSLGSLPSVSSFPRSAFPCFYRQKQGKDVTVGRPLLAAPSTIDQ